MFRKTLLALVAVAGVASAQKTNTFSVCAGPFFDNALNRIDAGLFTCNGATPPGITTNQLGAATWDCVAQTTQNTQLCTVNWVINGCTITSIAQWDQAACDQPISTPTWIVNGPAGTKCPKASQFRGLTMNCNVAANTGRQYTVTYTGRLPKNFLA